MLDPADPGPADDAPADDAPDDAPAVAAAELGDLTEDEWGPEADTGPTLRSAAVPQLDAFTLPETAVLPTGVADEPTTPPVDAAPPAPADDAAPPAPPDDAAPPAPADDAGSPDAAAAPVVDELPYAAVADDESPAFFDVPPSVTRGGRAGAVGAGLRPAIR